jgi:hypothetical protein
LLGRPDDGVLVGACELLRASGSCPYLVSDLSRAAISIPIGETNVEARLRFGGEWVDLGDVRAAVVCELAIGSPEPVRPEDAAYVREEIRASWLGLLASLQCTVLNRPRGWLPIANEPWQMRAFARCRGVPTVAEELISAAAAPRIGGRLRAAVDLSNGQTFWMANDVDLPHGGVYSVTQLSPGGRSAVVVNVGRHAKTFVFDEHDDEARADAPSTRHLIEYATAVTVPLGVDYGYCVFAETAAGFAFARASVTPPPFLRGRLDERIAQLLAAELELAS